MWIVTPEGDTEGSGVLLDKESRLAVTNAHVVGDQDSVDVYFPVYDKGGKRRLITERKFYLSNQAVLEQMGYYTRGHVVAKNPERDKDLAIIRLDGLPETAKEIDWAAEIPPVVPEAIVYVLGNPGEQRLWRWTLGQFLMDRGDFLHIQSDVFGGNSGGPVLNKQCNLIGIATLSDQHMNAFAIPVRAIHEIMSKVRSQ